MDGVSEVAGGVDAEVAAACSWLRCCCVSSSAFSMYPVWALVYSPALVCGLASGLVGSEIWLGLRKYSTAPSKDN